jgi:hypothetical protein
MPTTTPAAIPAVLEPPFFDFSVGSEVLVGWEAAAWVMMTVLPGAMLVMTVALSDAEEADVAVDVVDAAAAAAEDEEAEDFAAAADDELAELTAAPDEPLPPE